MTERITEKIEKPNQLNSKYRLFQECVMEKSSRPVECFRIAFSSGPRVKFTHPSYRLRIRQSSDSILRANFAFKDYSNEWKKMTAG